MSLGDVLETAVHIGAAIGIGAAAVNSYWARRHSGQINDAVNHTHRTGTPRLYDLVINTREDVEDIRKWKDGYSHGPLDNGQKVINFVDKVERMEDRLDTIDGGEDSGGDVNVTYQSADRGGQNSNNSSTAIIALAAVLVVGIISLTVLHVGGTFKLSGNQDGGTVEVNSEELK